jgi:hypothetical protein
MIIPIGVDCGVAEFCKKYNLRNMSFPFDWNVSYNGVAKSIDDEFKLFTEPLSNRINHYDVYFHHDFEHADRIDQDKEKYSRRCQRLLDILKTSNEEIIFCRKGHAYHHHFEQNKKYNTIASDIDDAEQLHLILSTKYPDLTYKIIVILVCDICFNPSKIYTSSSTKIEIHNIATPKADATRFEDCCRNIFNV